MPLIGRRQNAGERESGNDIGVADLQPDVDD